VTAVRRQRLAVHNNVRARRGHAGPARRRTREVRCGYPQPSIVPVPPLPLTTIVSFTALTVALLITHVGCVHGHLEDDATPAGQPAE